MPLTEKTRDYVGKRVLVSPFYGWGWARSGAGTQPLTYEEASGPAPFHVCIVEFFPGREPMGGLALIEESGHPYDGLDLSFSVRHLGTFDFVDRVDDFNVLIREHREVQERRVELDSGVLPGFGGRGPKSDEFRLAGFARIRDDSARPGT
jgi:hypothetical protein